MAQTYNKYTAPDTYAYSFTPLNTADIKVSVDNVVKTVTTDYTIDTVNSRISFLSGKEPVNGQKVIVYRDTPDTSSPYVLKDLQSGSTIRASELNTNYKHLLYIAEEQGQSLSTVIPMTMEASIHLGKDNDLIFEGATNNAHETTLTVTDPTADRTITLPNVTGNVVTTGDTGTVTSTMITDNTIVNADISTTAEIAVSKLADGAARQILQTDSDGAGVEWTNDVAIPGVLEVTGAATLSSINGAAVVTSGTSTSDTKVYSAKRCDELYYNIGTAEEIQSGETWAAADNKIATTAAIDARIVDLVDDVGGFVPIANETSFPNANPDVNNGAGTIVSIGVLAGNLTSNGSGVISISNGTVGNSTVTINGAAASTTYNAGYGLLVETTSTLNTYTFHRLSSKATEVTTVASNISSINSVASNASNINSAVSNASNINTVAGISADVTKVAAIDSDVTAVAGDAADIGACSTNIGNIAAIGSDLANNYANITDYGSITGAVSATSGTSDITTVANNLTNINTVSGVSANVTTVAGISANVTSVAGNATNINAVAGDATDIGAVAGKATEIGRLGTADAVADMALLGTTAVVEDMGLLGTTACVADMAILASADTVADMAILATTDVVADLNTLATADVVADLNTLGTADVVSDLNTLGTADAVSDMNTLAAISANITTVATNDSGVTICANDIANINAASTHATNAYTHMVNASAHRTQAESVAYNLVDSASSHTAWGNITDTGTSYFSNESDNILLTMSEGTATYNYGSIT